jgi:hypothetical protein
MQLDSGETLTVVYETDDPHTFTPAERDAIFDVAGRAVPEVRRVLPGTPASILLRVRSATASSVIPETGETGSNSPPNVVNWQVDPSRAGGVVGVAQRELRATLFHEIHHVVRFAAVVDRGIQGDAIREGLATAFERDFAGAQPPWGRFPVDADADAWTRELLALPEAAPRHDWLFMHPDGRRWIAFRVGTHLVDLAMHASGTTSADLVQVPAREIVDRALGADAGTADGRE